MELVAGRLDSNLLGPNAGHSWLANSFSVGCLSVAHCLSEATPHSLGKVYPVKQNVKPFATVIYPSQLFLSGLRSTLPCYLELLDQWLKEVNAAVEDDEDAKLPPFPVTGPATKRALQTCLKDLCIVFTRRVLERVVFHNFSGRTAWKLLKNLPESAKRKYARGDVSATMSMWKTAARQCIVGVAASLIVQEACDVYTFCSATRDENSRKKTKKILFIKMSPHCYLFVRKTCRNVVSAGLRITCTATGAAAGSKIYPGFGTMAGAGLGDGVGDLLADSVIEVVFGNATPAAVAGNSEASDAQVESS